ncbi:MAG: Nif3-like dinuclear metal center hexameric protein [Geodermatophilaceae bacterium]|nr:Nif3-like dinuclear metal center hexameric protein [Geodermatophilaceae bacterium]
MPTLSDVITALESRYDPALAESWDAVGLVCGDPDVAVRRVMFAVDPVASTVEEAIQARADLLVTHHPLFLTGVHGVPASDPKGGLIHRLISAGCGLFVAHTNADRARPGVNDALAVAVGLGATDPLEPADTTLLDKIIAFVPSEAAQLLVDALSEAGAGAIGDYSRAAFMNEGTGTFIPDAAANPVIGAVGCIEEVAESRIEMVFPRSHRQAVVHALRSTHPYEEPAYSIVGLATLTSTRQGLGRIGELERPQSLREFAGQVVRGLPETAGGLRIAGDPDSKVGTVAVCGGSGGSLIEVARSAGADVFLTSDLRHHIVSESREVGDLSLCDAAHWATEWPWLPQAARLLREDIADALIDITVSTRRTDPWTAAIQATSTQEAPDGGVKQW